MFICNRSDECNVPIEEDGMSGWKMGEKVALCLTCHDSSSCSPPDQGMRQFELDCACRGCHVYRNVWTPKRGENLIVENEFANVHDPFALSFNTKMQRKGFKESRVVGHIPREISRFCHYFLNYGGYLQAVVRDTHYRRSPIPKGCLEIPIRLIVKKERPRTTCSKK